MRCRQVAVGGTQGAQRGLKLARPKALRVQLGGLELIVTLRERRRHLLIRGVQLGELALCLCFYAAHSVHEGGHLLLLLSISPLLLLLLFLLLLLVLLLLLYVRPADRGFFLDKGLFVQDLPIVSLDSSS